MRRLGLILLLSVIWLSACQARDTTIPTLAPTPVPTQRPTRTPAPSQTPTPTPIDCRTLPGSVVTGALDSDKPPQEFLVYLPACYQQEPDRRFPVLYLLHGQTSTDTQWVDLGAPQAADILIRSGDTTPFIMVFPDDRYWNLPPGPGFGDRLVHEIIPYVDQNFRTLTDRQDRALGGLSRGGAWAVHVLLTRYDLFGSIGLHSPVIFDDDAAMLPQLMAAIPANGWPRLWLDAGDRDGGLGRVESFESLLTAFEVPHEWRMYTGDHTNPYWQAHLIEYLQWYADGFAANADHTMTPTP